MCQQLELDFASTLASALDEPEQADIALICASLDQYLQGRSHYEQLRVAGDAIISGNGLDDHAVFRTRMLQTP